MRRRVNPQWKVGLFHLVYRLVKRYGFFSQPAADVETATLVARRGQRGKSFFVLGMSMMHGRYEKQTPMSGLRTFEADISC